MIQPQHFLNVRPHFHYAWQLYLLVYECFVSPLQVWAWVCRWCRWPCIRGPVTCVLRAQSAQAPPDTSATASREHTRQPRDTPPACPAHRVHTPSQTSMIQCPPKVWRQSYRNCLILCCYNIYWNWAKYWCKWFLHRLKLNCSYMLSRHAECIVKIYLLCLMILNF